MIKKLCALLEQTAEILRPTTTIIKACIYLYALVHGK
jgi:hypothetical protein